MDKKMENWNPWIESYFDRYRAAAFAPDVFASLVQFHDLAVTIRETGRKLMFAGNGASASIASHGAVDFTKQGRVRSRDFNEANLITCFSNDYGYENWIAKAVAAAHKAKEMGISIVTFTGASANNPLRQLGDVNMWIDSSAYNIVECTHMIWLTTVVDMLVGKAEYSVV
jgi:D-sedoheptulose 7-phosphate isomerase